MIIYGAESFGIHKAFKHSRINWEIIQAKSLYGSEFKLKKTRYTETKKSHQ